MTRRFVLVGVVFLIGLQFGCSRANRPIAPGWLSHVRLESTGEMSYEGESWENLFGNLMSPSTAVIPELRAKALSDGFHFKSDRPDRMLAEKHVGGKLVWSVMVIPGRAYRSDFVGVTSIRIDKSAEGTAFVVKVFR